MGELATLLPSIGAFGVPGLLLVTVAFLLNALRVDRREYGEAIDKEQKRADAAEERQRADRAAAEGRERELQQQLDDARRARREAEDQAAKLDRENERLQERLGAP